MKNLRYNLSTLGIGIVVLVALLPGCKKFADPAPVFQQYTQDSSLSKVRKVLVIGIDGFSGTSLQTAKPAFLTAMLQHSKYNYALATEGVNTVAAAWDSWMTGTTAATHEVVDSSFSPKPDETDPDGDLPNPNNIFMYLLRYKPLSKSLLVTPWPAMAHQLLRGATKTILALDDKAVKDSAVLNLESTVTDLNVLHFNSIALAGEKGGFTMDNPLYKTQVTTVDGYIKEVVEAVKGRKTYSKENWLIMVVSNRGPHGLSPKPGFIMAYNPSLIEEKITANGDQVPMYSTKSSVATDGLPPSVYDLGPDDEMTVSFKLYVKQFSGNNPGIILKTATTGNGANGLGWWFRHNGGKGDVWMVFKGSKGSTVYNNKGISTDVGYHQAGTWHSYTGKVYKSGTKRYAQIYVDGVAGSTAPIDITEWDCRNSVPLTIGYPGSAVTSSTTVLMEQSVVDLRIYDTAIPDDVIAANACKTFMDPDEDPYKANLIAYFPCDEMVGNRFNNLAPNAGQDAMALSSDIQWEGVPISGEQLCYTSPNIYDPNRLYSIVAQNADVAANALFWLRLEIDPAWGLNGVPWMNNFEREYTDPGFQDAQ